MQDVDSGQGCVRGSGEEGERGEGSYKQSPLLLPPAVANLSIYYSVLPPGVVSGSHPETTVITLTVNRLGLLCIATGRTLTQGTMGSLITKVLRTICHRILDYVS